MEFIRNPREEPVKKQLEMYSRNNKSGALKRYRKKVNRNEPCVCGSGIKFKKCCGR